MGRLFIGKPGFLPTLITRGRSLSKVFGVSSGSVTLRGNIWAQPVQLAGMGSDSFCSQSLDDQGSKSERGRDRGQTGSEGQLLSQEQTQTGKDQSSFGDPCEQVWRAEKERYFFLYDFLYCVNKIF